MPNIQELFMKYSVYWEDKQMRSMNLKCFTQAIAEIISSPVEPEVKPACEIDKTQCKFCTRETTAEDFGYGKDKVCKSCLDKAIANELRNMEQ